MVSVSKRTDRPGHQVRWRDESRRQRKKTFRRKADADRYRAEVEHSLNVGTYVDPAAGRTTFREYAERWRAIQPYRPNTATRVRSQLHRHVYPVLGDRPLAAIRQSELQAFVAGLPLAPGSVRPVWATVRAVLGAAVRDRVIGVDPCQRIKLPELPAKRVVPLTVDQVRALAAAMGARYRAVVTVAAGTGLRQGELFGLQVGDVNFLRRTVTVERQVQPHGVGPLKNRASYRTIPVAPTVVETLAAHLAEWPAGDEGWIFTDDRGRPLTRRTFSPWWTSAVKAAGLPAVGMHSLRHFFASLLIAAGLSPKVVAERLGHANAAMTLNVYSHLWPDDEDRSRQAVEDVLGAGVPRMRPVKAGDLR
jgi:integrase